jgi:hypothetical protein
VHPALAVHSLGAQLCVSKERGCVASAPQVLMLHALYGLLLLLLLLPCLLCVHTCRASSR